MTATLQRTVTAFNLLALPLALVVACRYVVLTAGIAAMPWWEFGLTVALLAFIIFLPFCPTLSLLHEGGGEKTLYFAIVVNLLFAVLGGAVAWSVIQGQPLDAMEAYAIGFSPVALGSAAYLLCSRG